MNAVLVSSLGPNSMCPEPCTPVYLERERKKDGVSPILDSLDGLSTDVPMLIVPRE